MPTLDQPTCGRCGVYRHLHPTKTCAKPRLSFWWDRHYAWRHIAASLWLTLGDRRRMNFAHRIWSRNERLCWCDFVDAALLDGKRDYFECGCDVPLPVGIREPVGNCYCPPVCSHEWLDRPESDARECLVCGTEVAG